MLKVVVDTNQFVSSFLSKRGASARLIRMWREGVFLLVTTPAILREVGSVLRYPRIAKITRMSPEEVDAFVALMRRRAIMVYETPPVDVVQRDPADNIFLACAAASGADYVVSGDHHLLEVGSYQNIPIITVRELLARLS